MVLIVLSLCTPQITSIPNLDWPFQQTWEVALDGHTSSAIVSDSGTILLSTGPAVARYSLLNQQRIDPLRNALHAWSTKLAPKDILVFTDSQFKYTRLGSIPAPKMLYASDEFHWVGSWDGSSLFVQYSAKADNRNVLPKKSSKNDHSEEGIADVFFDHRGRTPNTQYKLATVGREHYTVFRAKLDGSQARMLLGHFPNGSASESGISEWWQQKGNSFHRLNARELSSDERRTQGLRIPQTIADLPISAQAIDSLSFDATNLRVLYYRAVYDLRTKKSRELVAPDPFTFGYAFLQGRLYCNARSGGYSKLYVESTPGKWKYLGPYNIIGCSASQKFVAFDTFSTSGPNNRIWVGKL